MIHVTCNFWSSNISIHLKWIEFFFANNLIALKLISIVVISLLNVSVKQGVQGLVLHNIIMDMY